MEQAQLRAQLSEPFDETEEFRDFVVWLCGFTNHDAPPSKAEWDALKDKTKHVAANFALRAREQRKKQAMLDYDWASPRVGLGTSASRMSTSGFSASTVSAFTGSGISGSATLTGNDGSITYGIITK